MEETVKTLSEFDNTMLFKLLGTKVHFRIRNISDLRKITFTLHSQSDLGKKQICDMNMNIHSKME